MSRLDFALFAALVLSALYLVQVSYESRRLFAELDREQTRATQLEGERERLQLEARAQSTPLRVERVARDRLGMRPATAAVTEYMPRPATATAPVSGASASAPMPAAASASTTGVTR